MSSKRWRVLSLACMYIESAPPDHDPRMPFFGSIIHSHDYEVQHMDVKLTREKGVRVVAQQKPTDVRNCCCTRACNARKSYHGLPLPARAPQLYLHQDYCHRVRGILISSPPARPPATPTSPAPPPTPPLINCHPAVTALLSSLAAGTPSCLARIHRLVFPELPRTSLT